MNRIPIDSAGVAHGVGLFETMLVVSGRVLQIDEHLERMRASCDALGFPQPGAAAFRREVELACAGSPADEAALRCTWIAAGAVDDPLAWRLAASIAALPEVTLSRRNRGRAITLDASFVRSMPQHKMTSYAVCVVGLRQAITRGADEALFVTRDGLVLEGSSTNVFAVRGRTLITASVAEGLLPGIVRAWVISAASRAGLAIEERAPSVDELRGGGFLTSSLTTLAELRVLDGAPCAPAGEAFERLQELWRHDFELA